MKKKPFDVEEDITDSQIRIVGTSTPFSADDMEDVLRENVRKKTERQDQVRACMKRDVGHNYCLAKTEDTETNEGHKSRGIVVWILVLLLLGVIVFFAIPKGGSTENDGMVPQDPVKNAVPQPGKDSCYVKPIVDGRTAGQSDVKPCVMHQDTTVNDIPLHIYTCNGGWVGLSTQRPTTNDKTLLFAAQAADIRGDIDVPAGAFVLHGELLSKGHSKLGFCSIIKNNITIGYARETSELESAIEQNGDFFRHYSLVCNSQVIEVPVKGKAIRRALCIKDEQICIVECNDRESYHDFSQALLDMKCTEALALVGGDALLFYWDEEQGKVIEKGMPYTEVPMKSENYIVWRK